jgi:hypothetical protein
MWLSVSERKECCGRVSDHLDFLRCLCVYAYPLWCLYVPLRQVMRNDLVPRFSTAAVEAMQQELLEIDYKGLMHDDLMEHEVCRFASQSVAVTKKHNLEHTKSAADSIPSCLGCLQGCYQQLRQCFTYTCLSPHLYVPEDTG